MNTLTKHQEELEEYKPNQIPSPFDFAFDSAAHLVVITQQASVTYLRNRLGITENLARRVMQKLHKTGVIGPLANDESAKVLISYQKDLESLLKLISLPITIGIDAGGREMIIELAKAKNILIAGAPGQGKTTLLNAIGTSLAESLQEDDIRIERISTETDQASDKNAEDVLSRLTDELIERSAPLADTRTERRPALVLLVDEFAHLVPERPLLRQVQALAQQGPKVGIHLIMTTASPTVDIISSRIKTLFPTRIALRTRSRIDSWTIIDMPGAEKLTAPGEMLLLYKADIYRLQGGYVER